MKTKKKDVFRALYTNICYYKHKNLVG